MKRAAINQKAAAQNLFVWEGVNKNGVKIKGETLAINANWLRATLRRQGITPGKIYKKPKPLIQPKIKPADIAQFARQMTTLMRSGVPIVQALEMVTNSSDNPAVQDLLKKVKEEVESGSSFGSALEHHPKHFDHLFVNLVKAGEQAGTLETMLDKVAIYKEKMEALKAKIKKALMYPIMIILAAIIVSAIMLVFVIPQFKEIFDGMGAELPGFTLWVLSISDWLQENWWMPLLIGGGAIYGFLHAKQNYPPFANAVDKYSLELPVMGNILRLSAIARFCRTLSTMFSAGVPLIEALDSVAGSTGNKVYYDASLNIKEDTSRGVQLHTAMQTTQLFPSMVLQMARIGEESGRLEEMLGKAADYYEEKVDDLVDTLSQQIEPLIMGILGVLVGGLIIAMYLPIFQMGASV